MGAGQDQVAVHMRGDSDPESVMQDDYFGRFVDPEHPDLELRRTYPEGGRGWLVLCGSCLGTFVTWGGNLALSRYMSYYIKEEPSLSGVSRAVISLITSCSLSVMFLVAPFSNLVENVAGIRMCVLIGGLINSLGLLLAAFFPSLLGLILFQAILSGIGRGLAVTPLSYVLSQWFDKRCTLVTGMCHAASGVGGIAFGEITAVTLEKLGLAWSFHINNIVSTLLLLPAVFLVEGRCPIVNSRTGEPVVSKRPEILGLKLMKDKLVIALCLRALSSQWSYTVVRGILPTYNTDALGLSSGSESLVHSIFTGFLAVGRPLIGIMVDKIGATTTPIYIEFASLISYWVLWYPSSEIILLTIFSAFQGSLFLTALPISSAIVVPHDVRSVMTFVWLSSALASQPSTFVYFTIVEVFEKKGYEIISAYRVSTAICSLGVLIAALISIYIHRGWIERNREREKRIQVLNEEAMKSSRITKVPESVPVRTQEDVG